MSHLPPDAVRAAGAIAAGFCGHLTEPEQAMFIAGFQEAIKYLNQKAESPVCQVPMKHKVASFMANQADDDDDSAVPSSPKEKS